MNGVDFGGEIFECERECSGRELGSGVVVGNRDETSSSNAKVV